MNISFNMFAYLKGSFLEISPTSVIVDVGGVGYAVEVSLNTYGKIEKQTNGLLYEQQIVRENSNHI